MPRRKSSLKSQRIDKKRHLRNLRVKQQLKKAFKQFHALVSTKSATEAKALLQKIYSQLDKAAKKQIIHPKTANRKKSRLTLSLARSAAKAA